MIGHFASGGFQIIASVLLQNARKVSSEESRTHLRDAHQRVMSVAAGQKQLAVPASATSFLSLISTQLCQSISASMIEDHDLVSIEVNGDGSATTSEVSVSLGLIVTELVINALKHAFPNGRKGLATVDYHSEHEGWALSICDDGVGMAVETREPEAGLGSAIMQALASQLTATITLTDLAPGTGVSLIHRKPLGLAARSGTPELQAV